MKIEITLTTEESEEVTLRHANALTAGETKAQTTAEWLEHNLRTGINSWRADTKARQLATLASDVVKIPAQKWAEIEAAIKAEAAKVP